MPSRWIVCADGTWNSRDQASSDGSGLTNVARIYSAVADTAPDGTTQQCFYHPGVGTDPSWFERVVGGAFGVGLSRNVQDCYGWLVDHYTPGDELFLFGFSRGAFTVRSLAGLIRKCGLLRREERGRIAEAYVLYRNGDLPPRSAEATTFRAAYSHPTPTKIRCLGVWDTVGALGMPTAGPIGWYTRRKFGFHDVGLNGWVENAFHALAIDERRKPFEPTLWKMSDDALAGHDNQRIEQVWFSGVHSNVGGGYSDSRLSDVALEWMLERAQSCGLALKAPLDPLPRPDCCGTLYESMTPFYRVFGQLERRVCDDHRDDDGKPLRTFERVHDSAFERRRKFKPPYGPANLRGLPRVDQPATDTTMRTAALLSLVALLAGCAALGIGAGAPPSADVRDASGRSLGTLTLTGLDDGRIRVRGTLTGLPMGTHGIHLHGVGVCLAPFTSAGAHWNPTTRLHGTQNPAGPHHGDMNNIVAGDDDVAQVDVISAGGPLTGLGGLLDADGASVVVHAAADDYRTDPSGNSGARIACGEIR